MKAAAGWVNDRRTVDIGYTDFSLTLVLDNASHCILIGKFRK